MTGILIGNERCKAISNLFFTLCAALIAGSAVRTWELGGPDFTALAWLLAAAVLAFLGWQTLGLLVPVDVA
jgi:hypothetical protein